MNKILLMLILFTAYISAQQNVIADTLAQMNEQLVGKIYYDPITNKLIMRNRTGATIQSLDISGSFVNRSDFNSLKDIVTNHINTNYTVNFGTGWTDYTDYAVKLFPSFNLVTQSYDYELYPISLDEFLGEYAVTISNMRQDIADLKDSLAQLANFIWGGGGIVHAYPQYAFYYKPINFGTAVTSDTTMTRWIRNTGTANMSVSYRSTSPFYVRDSSGGVVPALDSIKVYFRFKIGEAVIDQSYDVNVFISHNGGGTTGTSTTDTISCQGKWILTVNPDPTVADYYVSNTGTVGRDNGTGKIDDPFLTVSKGISMLGAGQTLALARGSTFNENIIINKDSIKIISYGTGLKPKITNVYDLPNWTTANWDQVATNIWKMTISGEQIYRLWIDGSEVLQAGWDDTNDEYFGEGDHYFRHEVWNNANSFYLYSVDHPTIAYSTLKIAGYKVGGVDKYHTVEINSNYVTIDSIDIQNGLYASIGGTGEHNTIKNCNIGYNTNKHAVVTPGRGQSGFPSSWTMLKDTVFSNWTYPYKFYDSSTPYGIFFKGDNWLVDSCYIKDWWFGVYSSGSNDTIRNNNITSPNFSFAKGIQIYPRVPFSGDWYQDNVIYNNYLHNLKSTGVDISSSGNKFMFNIIDSVYCTECIEKDPDCGNSGMAIEFASDLSLGINIIQDNYVLNNTITNTDREAIWWGKYTAYNNLFLNIAWTKTSDNVFAATAGSVNDGIFKNNLHFKTGAAATRYFASLGGNIYTATGVNLIGSNSGNFYPSTNTTLSQIMNTDFTLPSGSEALGTGVSIESLVGAGFKDRLGNTVTRSNPRIGAIYNTP